MNEEAPIYRAWYFRDSLPVSATKHLTLEQAQGHAAHHAKTNNYEFLVVLEGEAEVLAKSENAPNITQVFGETSPDRWVADWIANLLNAQSRLTPEEPVQIGDSIE